ncbi:unnamed protein product [Diplocarpon coronariae]
MIGCDCPTPLGARSHLGNDLPTEFLCDRVVYALHISNSDTSWLNESSLLAPFDLESLSNANRSIHLYGNIYLVQNC